MQQPKYKSLPSRYTVAEYFQYLEEQEAAGIRRDEICLYNVVHIIFPEVSDIYGHINASYLVGDIQREGERYKLEYWNAAGCERYVVVPGDLPLI